MHIEEQWYQEASTVGAFRRDNEIPRDKWPSNPPVALRTKNLQLSGEKRDVALSGVKGREDVWKIWGSCTLETDHFTIREDGRRMFLVDQARLHASNSSVSQRDGWIFSGPKEEAVHLAISKLLQDAAAEDERAKAASTSQAASSFMMPAVPGGARGCPRVPGVPGYNLVSSEENQYAKPIAIDSPTHRVIYDFKTSVSVSRH